MLFRQVTHDDLGCASYLIGDEDAGVAAVVDPKLHIEEYLRLARYLGVRIDHVLETHTHADHVSGHAALAEATGAVIHIHRDAGAGYDHEPFDDGWELELGALKVRALHTPGHRPEHTAFALIDTLRSPQPWAVLTGDTLFVGDIARPDLAVEKAEGARGIFRSLNQTLLSPNFQSIVALNRGPLVEDTVDVAPLAPRQVLRAQAATRRAGFGSKLGWLAGPDQPIVLVGRDGDDAIAAAQLAAAVGLRTIAGYLEGGMTSWREEQLGAARVDRLTVPELHDRRQRDRGDLQVLDVRERSEWEAGRIPGSLHHPYHDIDGIPDGIDPQRPVAVVCGSGQRAAVGASLLRRHGAEAAIHIVDGGVAQWQGRGWPIVTNGA